MYAKVHYWIVCDAVKYLIDEALTQGDAFARKAVENFQASYGDSMPIEQIPYYDGAIQSICGYEARNTDYYCDMAISTGKENDFLVMTGFAGHNFTAFNHFINVFVDSPKLWDACNGYHYGWSSQTGIEWLVGAAANYAKMELNSEHSMALERIEPYWRDYADAPPWLWLQNTSCEVECAVFAPVSALAGFYYSRLILGHIDEVQVSCPDHNETIAGLHLLGPVLHAIGDAVVPQHIRPALGLGHQAWEAATQTMVYLKIIKPDNEVIRSMLNNEPFNPWYIRNTDDMAGRFAEAFVISRIAEMARDRLISSMGKKGPRELWLMDSDGWIRYLINLPKFKADAQYLYNLAVAGTAHAILRAYDDLTDEVVGVLGPNGLNQTVKTKLEGINLNRFEAGEGPRKFGDNWRIRPEELLMSSGPRLYSLNSEHGPDIDAMLNQASSNDLAMLDESEWTRTTREFQESVDRYHEESNESLNGRLFPSEMLRNYPPDSDLSSHFGIATYQLPSEDEITDPKKFEEYVRKTISRENKEMTLYFMNRGAALRSEALKMKDDKVGSLMLERGAERLELFRSDPSPDSWSSRICEQMTPMDEPELPDEIGAVTIPDNVGTKKPVQK